LWLHSFYNANGGGAMIDHTPKYNRGQNDNIHFHTAIGYYNLSCPFE